MRPLPQLLAIAWLFFAGAVIAQPAGKPAIATKPSNRDAAQLVYQAQVALQRKNPDDAQKLLDSAKALNDEELRLWSTYGYLALAHDDKPTAESEFQKELTLHPQATEIYGALADLQEDLGKRTEAEATLQALVDSDPRAAAGAARLVHMLVEDGRPVDAVKLGQDAAAKFTEAMKTAQRLNPRSVDVLNFELSKAQVAAGMKDDGLASMVALLKVTANASIQNDLAFRLAIAGVELPLAESSARSVLLRTEMDSRRVTIDGSLAIQRQVMNGVTALWDTLAWVLYREGKIDEAESYARAAWLQKQDLTIGSHLAEIEAAKGNKNFALTVCEVSLVAKPEVKPAKTAAKEPVKVPDTPPGAADTAAVQAQAEKLRKSGAVSKGPAALDTLLTQPIAIRGVNGRGNFDVMMGFGIIELANPTAKDNATGMLAGLLGAKVTGLWPKDSGARLFMKAAVTCRAGGCLLQLHALE